MISLVIRVIHSPPSLNALSGSFSALMLAMMIFSACSGVTGLAGVAAGSGSGVIGPLVVVIFGAMPLVSQRGEHVVFDSLDHYLPAWTLRLQRVVVNLVCALVLLGLGWLMWRTGGQFLESGETTAQLKILKAPFLYGMGLLCALTGLVHIALIAAPGSRPAEGEGVAL